MAGTARTVRPRRALPGFVALLVLFGLLIPVRAQAIATPGGLAPNGGVAIGTVPVLTWNAVPDADAYYVELGIDTTFAATSLRFTGTVKTNKATPPWDLAPGMPYYWRVQAIDSAGEEGAFSAVATFSRQVPGAPVPTSPANGAHLDHPETAPVLTWNPMSGVKSYEVQWATNPNFTEGAEEIVGSATTPAASYAIDTLLSPGRDWYWRVRGKYPVSRSSSSSSTEDKTTEYSAARMFRLEWGPNSVPSLLGPEDDPELDNAVKNPEFRWSAVKGAAKYRLQISPSQTFDAITLDKTLLRTSYVPTASLTSGAYYWRVAALDADGSQGAYSQVREFYRDWLDDNGVSARPTIHVSDVDPVTPGVQVYRDDIFLSWDPIPGASHYEIEFASPDNPAFANKNAGKYSMCETAQTSVAPVYNGKYTGSEHLSGVNGGCDVLRPKSGSNLDLNTQPSAWVHVAAIDVKTASGELRSLWSDQARPGGPPPGALQLLLVDPPADGTDATEPAELLGPPDTSVHSESPHLQWRRVDGATKYRVAVSKSRNFDSTVLDLIGYIVTAGTHLTITEPLADSLAGESYYWYVLPCVAWQTTLNNTCNVPDWKAINIAGKYRAFRKNTPKVTGLTDTPIQGTGASGRRLAWYTTPESRDAGYENGTKYYQVEISTDPDFSDTSKRVLNPTSSEGRTDATVFIPEVKLNPGETYYWHVRAVDGGGQLLTWSETRSFTFSDPAAPTGLGTAGTGPMKTLRWNAVPGGNSYTIEVFSGANPAFPQPNRVLSDTSEYPAWTPPAHLPAGTYSWRVRRTDAFGMAGTWSSGVPAFTVSSAAPGLVTPLASAKVHQKNLAFAWNPVSGAASYAVEVSQTAGFASIFDSTTTTNRQWSPTKSGGYPAGTYYWRVRALSAASTGKVLATSSVRGVTVVTPPGRVDDVAANSVGKGAVAISWAKRPANEGGTPVTGYRLWSRATGGTWIEQFPVSPASAAARTVTGLADSTQYEFRVAARNAAGTGVASSIVDVTTAGPPEAPRSLRVEGILGGISARWSAPSSDLPVTGYRVAYRRVGTATWLTTPTTNTTWTKTGLAPNARYEFKVAARNAVGLGPDAVYSGQVITKAAPGVPRSVRVTPSTTSAQVAWLAPVSPGSSPVTSYTVSYRQTGTASWSTKTTSSTTRTLSSLSSKRWYQVKVAATNSAGTGPASPVGSFQTR